MQRKVRDWFMFPETALNEMEVEIPVSLSEPCILRAAVDKVPRPASFPRHFPAF